MLSTTFCFFCCFRVVRCHKSLRIQPLTMKIFSLHNAHRQSKHAEWQSGLKGDRWRHLYAHKHTLYNSLIGDVKGPAPPKVLAMTRSAICLRARRPVGLLPFVSWSWIRPSSSSLNTCEQKRKEGFFFHSGWAEEKKHKHSVKALLT